MYPFRARQASGVAFDIDLVVSADVNNYNLFTAAGSPAGTKIVRVTVNSGVMIGSTTTGTEAFTTGSSWAAGSTLRLVNNGKIQGMGGGGGNNISSTTTGVAGSPGGTAVNAAFAISIDNTNGELSGGGGGGGGGGSSQQISPTLVVGGGGGGGGAGRLGGAGGTGRNPGTAGSAGNDTTGGAGGGNGGNAGGVGGTGGNLGLAGAAGANGLTDANHNGAAGGAGGAAGQYAAGNSFITWIANGIRRGGVS